MPQIIIRNGDGFPYQRDIRELTGVGEDAGAATPAIVAEAKARYIERRMAVREEEFDRAGNVLPHGVANWRALVQQELIRAEHEIKSFTRETVRLELDDIDVLAVDWNEGGGEEIIEHAFEQGYAIWEAIQP